MTGGDKMSIAKILFKYPQKGDPIGELIDLGESIGTGNLTYFDLPSHVAVWVEGGWIEAIWPTVAKSAASKFDASKHEVVEIDLPDLATAEAWAKSQIGKPYSLLSCLEAEYFALTGKIINLSQQGMDCSQLGVNFCRSGKLQVLGSEPASLVRPSDLLAELIRQGGVIVA
jgi:hypothetical protein